MELKLRHKYYILHKNHLLLKYIPIDSNGLGVGNGIIDVPLPDGRGALDDACAARLVAFLRRAFSAARMGSRKEGI